MTLVVVFVNGCTYEAIFVSFNEAPNSFITSNEDFCSMFSQTQYI